MQLREGGATAALWWCGDVLQGEVAGEEGEWGGEGLKTVSSGVQRREGGARAVLGLCAAARGLRAAA